ncbi:transposon polyprotein reverse transcriptase [Apiospora saccharicola]
MEPISPNNGWRLEFWSMVEHSTPVQLDVQGRLCGEEKLRSAVWSNLSSQASRQTRQPVSLRKRGQRRAGGSRPRFRLDIFVVSARTGHCQVNKTTIIATWADIDAELPSSMPGQRKRFSQELSGKRRNSELVTLGEELNCQPSPCRPLMQLRRTTPRKLCSRPLTEPAAEANLNDAQVQTARAALGLWQAAERRKKAGWISTERRRQGEDEVPRPNTMPGFPEATYSSKLVRRGGFTGVSHRNGLELLDSCSTPVGLLHKQLPEIARDVGFVSRFSSDPDQSHMDAVHRIYAYLRNLLGGDNQAAEAQLDLDFGENVSALFDEDVDGSQ